VTVRITSDGRPWKLCVGAEPRIPYGSKLAALRGASRRVVYSGFIRGPSIDGMRETLEWWTYEELLALVQAETESSDTRRTPKV
jgi:hypothetical protein